MNNLNTKPLSGFMELTPAMQIMFNNIKELIEENYKLFGFIPMDNPLIERKEVLFAKAGGETETQIYELKKGDSELALRFDLTVSLARYVADKYGELTFPFKRYQIAKVYRGERPQAGRFREFYQADIDVIGDKTLDLNYDAEIPTVMIKIFRDLDLGDITVRINNRKIFNGLFESLELNSDTSKIMQSIDKLQKIGEEEIKKELAKLEIGEEKINKIFEFLNIKGNVSEVIESLRNLGIENEIFKEGIDELEIVTSRLKSLGVEEEYFKIDLTIARGLGYYTGTVYETILNDYPEIGSICSGGRYEDLASEYTNKKLPGVGMSIGVTRLFDQLVKKGLLVPSNSSYTKVLVLPMSENAQEEALKLVSKIRYQNIPAEIDLNFAKKFGKRIKYADKLNIPYVIFIGDDELKENKYTLKNLNTGEQKLLTLGEVLKAI